MFDKESYTFSQQLYSDIRAFIDDEYVDEHDEDFYDDYESERDTKSAIFPRSPRRIQASVCENASEPKEGSTLREYLNDMDKSFQEMLIRPPTPWRRGGLVSDLVLFIIRFLQSGSLRRAG